MNNADPVVETRRKKWRLFHSLAVVAALLPTVLERPLPEPWNRLVVLTAFALVLTQTLVWLVGDTARAFRDIWKSRPSAGR
jgi:hypothetical protein